MDRTVSPTGVLDCLPARLTSEEILEVSQEHKIQVAVFRESNDSFLRRKLETEVRKVERKFALRVQALKELLANCSDREIEVILLKGMCFASELFANNCYKDMNDVDVLVGKSDVPEMVSLLWKLGYVFASNVTGLNETRRFNLPMAIHPKTGVAISVHWNLKSPNSGVRPGLQEIFAGAVSINYQGLPARRMSWEHNMVHVCTDIHFFKVGLRELMDIAVIIKTQNLDWSRVEETAFSWSACDGAYRGLRLSNEIFDLGVSEDFLHRIRGRAKRFVVRETDSRLQDWISRRSTIHTEIEKMFYESRPRDLLRTLLLPAKASVRKVMGSSSLPARLIFPYRVLQGFSLDYGWSGMLAAVFSSSGNSNFKSLPLDFE